MCHPLVVFIVRVTIASIGVVVGIAAAFVFGIKFDNDHAAGWAAVSSLFALITLIVEILVYKKKLNDWSLTLFALVGATGIVLGATAFILYIVLGYYDKPSEFSAVKFSNPLSMYISFYSHRTIVGKELLHC